MSAREYAEAYAAQEAERDRMHHQSSSYPPPPPPPPPPGLSAAAGQSSAQPYQYTQQQQQQQPYQYSQQYAQSYAPQQNSYSHSAYSQAPGTYLPSYSYPQQPQQQQQSTQEHAAYHASYYQQHNQPHQGYNYAHVHSQYQPHYPGHPPPPPPPVPVPPPAHSHSGYNAANSGSYNPHTGNYQPNYQPPTAASTQLNNGVPPLASSFVKSTSTDLTIQSIVSPLSAPLGTATTSSKLTTTGRGEVSFASSSSASSTSASSAISGTPAVGGIQFQMKKKSRWDNSTNALAKQDTTVSKSVSETVAPPVAPSASPVGSTPADPVKDYIERSLKACPPELYSRMTELLRTKIAKSASIDWSREPLAHLQLAPTAAPTLPPPPPPSQQHATLSNAYNYTQQQQQHQPPSSLSYQRPMNNFPSGFQSKPPYLQSGGFTGANNMPLGVRPSLPSPSSAVNQSMTPTAYEDADYIPFSNSFGQGGKHGKKRGWGASQDSPSSASASPSGGTAAAAAMASNFSASIAQQQQQQQQGNKKKKKKMSHFGFGEEDYSPQPSPRHNQLNASDRAKVNDRASRFAEYNAEVAQSETVFKNPIQRHLFTAERNWGDDDLELDWGALHIVGTCEKLEKRYLRLTQAPDPSVVRPERVLQQSLQMVLDKWRGNPTGKPDSDHIHDYKYTCDQFKSMRQDLTVQHLVNSPLIFQVYEHHARIALEVGDYSEYNQCQTQLKNLYLDHPSKSENQLEFISYRILYNLITNNQSALTEMLREIQKATDEQMQSTTSTAATTEAEAQARKLFHQPLTLKPSPAGSSDSPSPISLAFQVAFAALQNDSFTFFRLYNSLPFQGPLILRPFAASFRFKALTTLVRSFRPGKVEVAFFERSLGIESIEAAREYLGSAGGVFTADGLLDCKLTELHEIEEEDDDAAQHGVTHALL